MTAEPKLSHTSAMILQAVHRSQWEKQSIADADQRPPRKYYKLTTAGKSTLEASRKRYPLLAKIVPSTAVER
jgi:PadR family transcriptional regulator PadR